MKINSLISICCAALVFAACAEKDTPVDEPSGDVAIPELPADPQPENTEFNHRILLLQHTGTYCSNCPNLMTSLKELSQMEHYADKYQHVAAHSYNQEGDPAYSQAAANLSQAFCDGYYPELTFNLTRVNTGTSLAVSTITGVIDRLHKEAADVGIAAAAGLSDKTVGVNVQIKAATPGQYRVAVWVLEDGIRGKQEGATEDWMNTHGNAVRSMAGNTLNLRIYGEKIGELQAGQTAEKTFTLSLDETWQAENCKVLVLVNAAGSDGRYDLANCILCPVGSTVTYDYK
ncbi:MAG: Omp28-related outer membrane protein [Bacteroidales bacterium]|nr:Omp28-related outer membrane protein [Bacteroidales bacterium]